MKNRKILSLFDGSGGFPLAASLCGIEPVAASEVEPYPIAVTRSRFPGMKHLGSVTDINGGEIEPVDIITFGSPCQDLSVAGKRAGLKHEANGDDETTRSGLFMEAVRIIREMREATNGRYPTFALWENVPGAFSSNKGEDFRTVCEELIKIVEPGAVMPSVPQKGWPYADCYCGDGWSLAYRVFDAQYWGVPQRRRRIHLILDLRGERAGKVLFEREGLRGYFAESGEAWQATAGDAESGFGADDREGIGLDLYNHAVTGDKAVTLTSMMHKGGTMTSPTVAIPINTMLATRHKQLGRGTGFWIGEVGDPQFTISAGHEHAVCYTLEPGIAAREGGHIYEGVSGTLRANAGDNQMAVAYPVPNLLLDDQGGQQISVRTDGKCPTLRAEAHGNVPCVVEAGGFKELNSAKARSDGFGHEVSPTLSANKHDACVAYSIENHPAYGMETFHCTSEEEKVPTLKARDWKDPNVVAFATDAVHYIVRRLTPTECARLQGFPDNHGHPDSKENFTDEEYRFWLDVRNTHAAINGKATKEYTKEQMLKWYNGLHTDSAEYKMWGNGIALPPALYCMQGMAEALNNEED